MDGLTDPNCSMNDSSVLRGAISLAEAKNTKIVRPRAELREGPGTAYYVLDKILTEGATVIVTERYFRWRKVTAPGHDVVGWLHEKTLSNKPLKEGFLAVELSTLPSLFTPRRVKKIYDYETSKAIATKFPKGTKFYRLKKVKKRYLVIIEDTLSIAWINEGDLI